MRILQKALTFDDVLSRSCTFPSFSPRDVSLATRLIVRNINPICHCFRRRWTPTERSARYCIGAREGGIGIIHKTL